METDSIDFSDWIKGRSKTSRKKRLYMDRIFLKGIRQTWGIPSCETRDMWTQNYSCDFLNWSKQQQKSWAHSKRLCIQMLGRVYLYLSGNRSRTAQNAEQQLSESSTQENRKLTGCIRVADLEKKKIQCWQPSHCASFNCVKNRRHGVKAEQKTLNEPDSDCKVVQFCSQYVGWDTWVDSMLHWGWTTFLTAWGNCEL